MAGPTITIAVVDDSDDARKGLGKVGQAADEMAADVHEAAGKVEASMDGIADAANESGRRARRSADELGEGVEHLDGKASAAERGFRGFSDSLNGTSDVMGGLQSGNLVQLGMGMADLFGAVQDLFLPLLQQMAVKLGLVQVATEGQTVAQEASNVAMAANPITIVVLALAALAAAFYLAWTKSETFREIVTGAFDAVRAAATTAFEWVRDHWPLLLAIITGPIGLAVLAVATHWSAIKDGFRGVVDGISTAAGTVKEIIVAPFRLAKDGVKLYVEALEAVVRGVFGAIKAVIDGVKQAVDDLIGKIRDAVDAVKNLPGAGVVRSVGGTLGGIAGHIPGLASGGIVTAPTLAVVGEAGPEAVVPLSRAGGLGTTINYYPAGYNRRELADAQRRITRLQPT